MRFGYDGSGFAGWARQPGLSTVEGEIERARRRWGWADVRGAPAVAVASRTDRGVSARGNAVALEAPLDGPTVLRALNGISPRIWFTAARPVPPTFRVRRARRRIYRYFEPPTGVDRTRRLRAAAVLTGRIDVRSFGRGLGGGPPVIRTVEAVDVRPAAGGFCIEVRAPAFVWGMVRKIVGALREYDAGRLTLAELRAATRGRARLSLPLAEPERLVLWEVDYPEPWAVRWAGPNRHQRRFREDARGELWARTRVLEALARPPEPAAPGPVPRRT